MQRKSAPMATDCFVEKPVLGQEITKFIQRPKITGSQKQRSAIGLRGSLDVPQLPRCACDDAVRFGQSRRQGNSLLAAYQSLCMLPEIAHDLRQVVMGFGQVRVERDRPLIALDRVRRPARGTVGVAEIGMRGGEARCDGYGLLNQLNGAVGTPAGECDRAE